MRKNEDGFDREKVIALAQRYHRGLHKNLCDATKEMSLNECAGGDQCLCLERSLAWGIALSVHAGAFFHKLKGALDVPDEAWSFASTVIEAGVETETSTLVEKLSMLEIEIGAKMRETLINLLQAVADKATASDGDDAAEPWRHVPAPKGKQ